MPLSEASTHTTNADLALLLGQINTRIALIEATTKHLDNAVNGNGKPGLTDEFRNFNQCFRDITQRVSAVENQIADHISTQNAAAKEAKTLLADEVRAARDLLAEETRQSKAVLAAEVKIVTDRREKISGRIWAVIILAIAAAFTSISSTVSLLIQNGIVK